MYKKESEKLNMELRRESSKSHDNLHPNRGNSARNKAIPSSPPHKKSGNNTNKSNPEKNDVVFNFSKDDKREHLNDVYLRQISHEIDRVSTKLRESNLHSQHDSDDGDFERD